VICRANSNDLSIALARAAVKDCRSFVSFGIAGGLLPNLSPGSCIIGSEIISGAARLATDLNWSKLLLQAIPDAIYGRIVGVSYPVAHPEAKRALYAKSGAVVVDMESHIVASVAAANRQPFAAIRVVIDPAERELPQAALAAIRPNGTIDIIAMMRSVLGHPGKSCALAQTMRDGLAAHVTLRRIRRSLGAVLGQADLPLG